eukprot:Gb_01118 [translate_table: standard]
MPFQPLVLTMGNNRQVLLFFFYLVITAEIQAQDHESNVTGYSCSSGPFPCDTYVLYRAQAPDYLSLDSIGDLFGISRLRIAKASDLPSDSRSLVEGQPLLVPVMCSCMGNLSQANISYQIVKYDTFYVFSTRNFEYLTTYQATEAANPTLIPTRLTIGVEVVFPIRCQCPTQSQSRSGLNMVITYVVQKGDTMLDISKKFGAKLQDLNSQNGMPSTIFPNTTLLIPVSEKPSLSKLIAPSSPPSPAPVSDTHVFERGSSHKGLIIGVSIAGACGLVGIAVLVFWVLKNGSSYKLKNKSEVPKKPLSFRMGSTRRKQRVQNDFLASVTDCIDKPFIYFIEDLKAATQNFSPLCNIQGSVYKGTIDDRNYAIKQMKGGVSEELRILQKVNHINLVKLEGICISSEGQSFLVYEYAENGSLNSWLHNPTSVQKKPTSSSSLTWKTRLQIALDVANGLQYIHEHTTPSVVHKDIKSSNILLDRGFRAKIANFGMAKSGINALTKHIVGTQGYMAPEYLADGLVTPKLDVFAFGVVLLELISGKEAILRQGGLPIAGKEGLLWNQIKPLMEGQDREEKLRRWIDPLLQNLYPIDSVMGLAIMARACVEEDPGARPFLSEIVYRLSKAWEDCPDHSADSCEISLSVVGR